MLKFYVEPKSSPKPHCVHCVGRRDDLDWLSLAIVQGQTDDAEETLRFLGMLGDPADEDDKSDWLGLRSS